MFLAKRFGHALTQRGLVLDEPGCDKTELASEICELSLGCHIRIRKGNDDTRQIPVIILHTHFRRHSLQE